MKKLVIPLVAVLTMAATLTVIGAAQAGATTSTTTAPVSYLTTPSNPIAPPSGTKAPPGATALPGTSSLPPGDWLPINPANGTVEHQYKQYMKTSKAAGAAYVNWGFPTSLLVLSHDDTGSTIVQIITGGIGGAMTTMCGILAVVPVVGLAMTGICALAMIAQTSYIEALMVGAWDQVNWQQPWYCIGVPAPWLGGRCPGAQAAVSGTIGWNAVFWGWVVPVRQTGLNILFADNGIPIGYQYNYPDCPC